MMLYMLMLLVAYTPIFLAQDQCYCFTANSVNIRDARISVANCDVSLRDILCMDSACGNVIGSADSGQCYTQEVGQKCELSGTTYNFVKFNYGSTTAWAADNYINAAPCGGQDQCYCFTANSVNIRDAPCGNVIGSANSGQCYTQEVDQTECVLSGTTYNFVKFKFGSTTAWAANNYINAAPCGGQEGVCGNILEVVNRAGWGARPPKASTPLNTPVGTVFVHHTVTSACTTRAACITKVKNIQDYHMDGKGWRDIGYNFLIGDDGRAYEGRGWNIQGAHTGSSCNPVAVAVTLIGNFDANGGVPPSQAMTQLTKDIIDCGIQQGYILPWATVNILGHRDACATSCPGSYMYSEIQTWPWFGRSYPCNC